MRYLKSFEKYKLVGINEEESVLSTAALAASLLFGNVDAKPDTVGVKTEVAVESPKLKVNYLEASTSDTKCYNNALHKFGLTKEASKFYSATLGELKARFGGDTSQILVDFKPLQSNIKATDYLQIGDTFLADDGTQIFDIRNDSQIVIASANGLLALTRASRAASDSIDYSVIKVSFKSERGSASISYDLSGKTQMTAHCNSLFYIFQTSITPKSKFQPTSIGLVNLPQVIGATEEFQVEYILNYLNTSIGKFIPIEIKDEVLKTTNFTKFDSEMIKTFLQKCKETGEVNETTFKTEILVNFRKFYLENFRIFVDKQFPKKVADELYNDYSKEVRFKLEVNVNCWQDVGSTKMSTKQPTYKAPGWKYTEGN